MASSTEPFNIVFVGAGNVMFGSEEGPWNQALRFEQKLGKRFRLVALVEPYAPRADFVLSAKRADPKLVHAYQDTVVFPTFAEFVAAWKGRESSVRAFVVGSPPSTRGSAHAPADTEIQIVRAFPHAAILVEKPVSASAPADAHAAAAVLAKEPGADTRILGVGYMLRYLKAATLIKNTIREHGLQVMATHARYGCAYESIVKPPWWDKSLWGGPIVEQATHFCDLSRFFGGDVDLRTVRANALEWNEPAGKLSKVGVDEEKVKPENRIPRATSANWKYTNGAVGSLMHVVGLQGTAYSCEIEVFADGYLFKLIDPYGKPILKIRRPGSDAEETHTFEDEEPFYAEVSAFIDSIEGVGTKGQVLSSFADACGTYELSWAIRLASEEKR